MNIPSITLSSAVYFPGKWSGYNKKNKIFRKNLECSPCLKKVCKYGDNRCMNAINVEEVWEYIENEFIH